MQRGTCIRSSHLVFSALVSKKKVAQSLGHRSVQPLPALAGFHTYLSFFSLRSLSALRIEGSRLTLMILESADRRRFCQDVVSKIHTPASFRCSSAGTAEMSS